MEIVKEDRASIQGFAIVIGFLSVFIILVAVGSILLSAIAAFVLGDANHAAMIPLDSPYYAIAVDAGFKYNLVISVICTVILISLGVTIVRGIFDDEDDDQVQQRYG